MSIGNEWLHFDYKTGLSYVYGENHDVSSKEDMNLISNGSGKTVVLVDAPLFALYGKTQRKIKKCEIVNIQNGSDCEVKLCLEKDGVEYIIERGLKPDKITIIKDGVNESEEAKKRQSNKVIEEDILDGISYEVFKNLIVLNGTSSKHFFEYGKNEKRVFINEVFRLGFLDFLQCKLSEEVKEKKTEVEKTEIRVESKAKEIERLKHLVEAQESGELLDTTSDLKSKIEVEKQNITNLQSTIAGIETDKFKGNIDSYRAQYNMAQSKIIETNNEIIRLNSSVNGLRDQYKKLKTDYENISSESVCSHCTQVIPDILKSNLFNKLKNEGSLITGNAKDLKDKKEDLGSRIVSMNNWIANAKEALNAHQTRTHELSVATTLLQEYNTQLNIKEDPKTNLQRINEEIKTAEQEYEDFSVKLSSSRKEFQVLKISRDLVGGKNFYGYYIGVFRNYLNKSINEYLGKMSSPHQIKLNNSLEADVYDGKTFMSSYENLSTGEKSKINLALLLSFYDVLHSFHRMETNLLILDEVLDSGLDTVAVSKLHDILKEKVNDKKHLCLYVVSHKEPENTFAEKEGIGKVVFSKKQGFTQIDSE